MKERIFSGLNNFLITLMFCSAIFVPLSVGIFEKDKKISKVEKRKLSKSPSIPKKISDIEKFPRSFDTYYSDHFGLRDWFIKYYKLLKYGIGDSPSRDVTIGKNGWLFLGSIEKGYKKYSDPMGDVRNINLFSQKELRKFARYMMALRSWLKDKGIEYVFVIAPSKHTIYFEQLPDYVTKNNDYSATDQLIKYLNKHTEVNVIDLREILIAEKDKHELFYKTDTHWNSYAANIVQYEIMKKIERIFPGQVKPELYRIKSSVRGGGDLAGFIGIKNFEDSNPRPIFKQTCRVKKPPSGTKSRLTFTSTCKGQKLNAVIFRDSFFSALQPYFARKFKRATYIWRKLDNASLKKYIALEKPNIIIEEWVERGLPYVPNEYDNYAGSLHKDMFNQSSELVFTKKAELLKFNKWLELEGNDDVSLRLKSTGNDPIIFFPILSLEQNRKYIVHIEISSSVKSILQLFYSDARKMNRSFTEKKSKRIMINKGENDIYISLEEDNLGKYLRLDPLSKKGSISIKSLDIKEVEWKN